MHNYLRYVHYANSKHCSLLCVSEMMEVSGAAVTRSGSFRKRRLEARHSDGTDLPTKHERCVGCISFTLLDNYVQCSVLAFISKIVA